MVCVTNLWYMAWFRSGAWYSERLPFNQPTDSVTRGFTGHNHTCLPAVTG